jgi:predicted esterase
MKITLQDFSLLLVALLLCAAPLQAQQNPGLVKESQILKPGVILPKIVTLAKPEQSYALYLPSTYSSEKRWPIVYVFDPGARGSIPVELLKAAAERYGYIVVGSNNSRNGSWKIEAGAAEAIVQDIHARLAVDNRRVYFAGLSGGARVAARIAELCKCAAGVLLNGAGFQPEASASHEAPFVVFAAVGSYDFNYGELVRSDEELEKLGYAHFLRRFDGPHQWAPPSAMDEALAWFRLQSMKRGGESRDDSFVALQEASETERAHALEQSGDLYAAWKEYRQAAEMLAGLTDNTALKVRADALEKDKAVREGLKREKQEFEEQEQLSREISSGLYALQENQINHADTRRAVEQQFAALRNRVEHEKHEEKLRVLKRALSGVFVQAMEMGGERLDQKDPSHAKDYFELACVASPDSTWALSNLAVASAMDGDRKAALDALRRAKSNTKDPVQFAQWLKEEPAFVKFHDTPEYGALLNASPQH